MKIHSIFILLFGFYQGLYAVETDMSIIGPNQKKYNSKLSNSQDWFYKELNFNSNKERADSLRFFKEMAEATDSTERGLWEKKFFCAFPNSFKGMQAMFGFDDKLEAAPLYYSGNETRKYLDKHIISNEIGFFHTLESIPDSIYYRKYINICINGLWEADNIGEAFGFHYKLIDEMEKISPILSSYSDLEIKSVFQFIFDGPHPKNKENERIFQLLKSKMKLQSMQLEALLSEAYKSLLEEHKGHQH